MTALKRPAQKRFELGAPVARGLVRRTRGVGRGPITRLMSPGDLGALVRPFVFLDRFESDGAAGPGFAPHPHSGIATLTTFLEGGMRYADSTGKAGALGAGSLEWMRAGAGVWHAGGPLAGQPARGYQLWLALGPDLELGRAESRYVRPDEVPQAGPARVVLGAYAGERSPIPFETALVLHVRLANGERWRFEPPPGHDVAWLSVNAGRVHAGDVVLERELAVFADGEEAVEILAEGPVELILGSAPKHPHPLVEGHYSVHTSRAALAEGERVIETLRRTPAVAALRRGT